MNILDVRNLSGGYGDIKTLNNINFSAEKGSFIAIAGKNGTGKTTLLKFLIKELKPKNNSVFLNGKDINSYSPTELAQNVSFLSQYSALNQNFTVREAVAFGRFCHKDEKYQSDYIDLCIEKTGLKEIADKPVTRISGGEFQLTMLARVLCQDTRLILLDEPSNNLDPHHQLMLMNIIRQETANGKTVIAVMHDLTAILNYADKTLLIKDGTNYAYGKTADVITKENIRAVFDVECAINLSRGLFPSAFCYSL